MKTDGYGKVCEKHPELKGARRRSDCPKCVVERMRAWRLANPERDLKTAADMRARNRSKISAANRARYWADPEKAREENRAKRAANPLLYRQIRRRWTRKNPEKKKEYAARWMEANRSRMNAYETERRARKLAATPSLTAIERARVQEFYDIAAARTAQTGEQWHVDHDKPLARGGLHHPDNLVLLPASINSAKGAWFDSTIDFLLS